MDNTCTGEGSAKTGGKHFWRAVAVKALPDGQRETVEECFWCKTPKSTVYGTGAQEKSEKKVKE